jgi:phage antirepressor YoqD-like protein
MSNIIPFGKMTSMEIAEITGKEHYTIMRDIRDEMSKLADGGINTEYKFVLSERQDSTGRKIPYYELTREGVLQLAARYDAVVRAKLIEMATRNDRQLPASYKEALLALVAAEEERERLLPKAEYYDDMAERNHLTNFRDTAKELKMKESDFIDILDRTGYIYRDSKGKIKPYADHVPDLFEVKEFVAKNGFAANQTLITHKGREKFRILAGEGRLCQRK